ncbi:ATP-dependent dethiobiotin synthetase BioD [Chlamydia avium]|uniref:ATP-dependent dethiobiotin synthetase BioD n=2 Tax=Chlamydia avium TaxID=1457141 RepID=W8K0E4_9CHLA|nr:dethiobiotin synthase [Chlamydia avium]AHK63352.1 ATP-dependent dethiobiotin synthetase BioD [Chlamydia avium 10DC88]EPP36044.1 dethiobiotin synthase [Chlamydia psittaci 10_743_SC13]EPP38367.1 dethiobiotin synthase [Chlamydia avium]VVT42953.1 ATP-dependent dethiobiotin synthetase BioD [Chlamydia avium]
MQIIIAGIHTEVGKTLASAILTSLLRADYWKPIQSGSLDNSDSHQVQKLSGATCHPEAYRFIHPLSPHQAAEYEGIHIDKNSFSLPKTDRPLIIETSGGFLSPCTSTTLQGDLFSKWPCSWILVSKAYLGSINHTCLTVEAMRRRKLNILGIILNQYPKHEENWLLKTTQLSCLGRLNYENSISKDTVKKYVCLWKPYFQTLQIIPSLKKCRYRKSGIPLLNQS